MKNILSWSQNLGIILNNQKNNSLFGVYEDYNLQKDEKINLL
jgi:hypothetical protein